MIAFSCPNCGKSLHAPEEKAGAAVNCPGCRQPLNVPGAALAHLEAVTLEPASAADAPLSMPALSDPALARRHRKMPVWAWLLLGLVGLFMIGAVGIGMVAALMAIKLDPSLQANALKPMVGKDGRAQIMVPPPWRAANLRNDMQGVQVSDTANSSFIIVISEPKTDFEKNTTLNDYTQLLLTDLRGRATNFKIVQGPETLTVGGRPALRYEITATVDKVHCVFFKTFIDGTATFHQVHAWTVPSKAQQQRPVLISISNSFTEVPGAAGIR